MTVETKHEKPLFTGMKRYSPEEEVTLKKNILPYFDGDSLATDVWFSKYRIGEEIHPVQMFNRCAMALANKEQEIYGKMKFDDVKDKIMKMSNFGKEFFSKLLDDDRTVLDKRHDAYMNYFDHFKYIIPGGSMLSGLGNMNVYQSLSNCLVLGQPKDSYAGILFKEHEMVQTLKRRCGIGNDLSLLRPEKSVVHNQSNMSSGCVLFLERYSHAVREVAQGGRRGAAMISLRVAHPDILPFIKIKRDLTKVTGANISVIVSDEFMDAVRGNKDYICRFPVNTILDDETIEECKKFPYEELHEIEIDGKKVLVKRYKAKEIFEEFVYSNWLCAEPGLLFENNIEYYGTDTCYQTYRFVTTNPCFAAGTMVLTDNGYFPIEELVGKKVNVWNGEEWSEVEPRVTGENQPMLRITLSDGTVLENTDYHGYPIEFGDWNDSCVMKVEAKNLKIDDKIADFRLPVVKNGKHATNKKEMYTRGFYSGVGLELKNGIDNLLLVPKNKLEDCINFIDFKQKIENQEDRADELTSKNANSVFYVLDANVYKDPEQLPFEYSIEDRMEYLSGLIDSCGEVFKNEIILSLQNYIKPNLAQNIKLLLTTLGVKSRVEEKQLGLSHLFIPHEGVLDLMDLLNLHHVNLDRISLNVKMNDSYITIEKIERIENADKVYCFTEPKLHRGTFNGILLSNCGEQPLATYDCCRLSATNLYSYVDDKFTKHARVDFDKLYEVCYNQIFFLDTIVELELDHIDHIIDKIEHTSDDDELMKLERDVWIKIRDICKRGRRCGAGIMGLSDMLAALNLPYDPSNIETLKQVADVMRVKTKAELDATTDLAILLGTFDGFNATTERETPYNHLFKFIEQNFPLQWNRMQTFGRRNVSWSTVAPTGSTGIEAQVTGGIEPMFVPFYKRRKKCMTENDRVDFVDIDGEKFTEYFVIHKPFMDYCDKNYHINNWEQVTGEELEAMFKQSPYYNNRTEDISHDGRVQMQSIVQRYTTSSISSTINLPKDVTREVISSIYMNAWENGLKGITVYREGSRGGIIVKNDDSGNENFEETKAPKRPKKLDGNVHVVEYRKKKYFVVIGLYDNKPYECFLCPVPSNNLLEKHEFPLKVDVIKCGKNHYRFKHNDIICDNIQDVDNDDMATFGLMVSTMMRHRVPLKFICKSVDKANLLVTAFQSLILHVLNTYLPNEETGEECPECHGKIRRENGCLYCPNCGYSKC